MKLDYYNYRLLYLKGTRGSGKSYNLAALACMLMKNHPEKSIVYLPDCRGFLNNPFGYLQRSLTLAYYDNLEYLNPIRAAKCIPDLITIVESASTGNSKENKPYFIIDQFDALDMEKNDSSETEKNKKVLHRLLDKICFNGMVITGSIGKQVHIGCGGETTLFMYEGLSDVSVLPHSNNETSMVL